VHDCDVCIVGGRHQRRRQSPPTSPAGAAGFVLCEKDDLAAHTSGASTKLIHGGLRYLEYYEFSLVRKALGRARGAAEERAAHHAGRCAS
jgi:glycerol-3-phosphate dehydrogenase